MTTTTDTAMLFSRYVVPDNHGKSDYFSCIKELVGLRNKQPRDSVVYRQLQGEIDRVYSLIEEEMRTNSCAPVSPISFGTSGWRGIIGKDLFCRSVALVTQAIISLYDSLPHAPTLAGDLGVSSPEEARKRGCVLGHDNRFGGALLAESVKRVLTASGFVVHDAGESTTGALSAALLELGAAFSVNLTPSHNPLEYAGFKYNAADGGPAAPALTKAITERARRLVAAGSVSTALPSADPSFIRPLDALAHWKDMVRKGVARHGLHFDRIIEQFLQDPEVVCAIDCVHGASRVHMNAFFSGAATERLILLRTENDPTFGGIAPEPSAANMRLIREALAGRSEPFKVGVIIDPDADRIRFTDGQLELTMNHFGAMAYHYLHEHKAKRGLVAKTVATSNFANAIACAFGEEVYEPAVGFKNFKPVIEQALVCFEESDGITVIGHTPEKDAYIGLVLALDMILSLRKNLGDYLREIEDRFGRYAPFRDGIKVSQQGETLQKTLAGLDKYGVGTMVTVGGRERTIREVITIDGRKMILDDGSWIMVRPSGTEPKVRFYLEGRTENDRDGLLAAARAMLTEIGLL